MPDTGSNSETTYYIGGLMEKVITGSLTDYRHYIKVGGESVAVYSRTSASQNTLRYVLSDHQGSIDTIASSSATRVIDESFTAYGLRRDASTWSGAPSSVDRALADGITRQGYTFQTVLGRMGLNHMNGRVQDAVIGRFVSPDPFVTEPGNTQNLNRYAYLYNNPLTYIDPSGFSCTMPGEYRRSADDDKSSDPSQEQCEEYYRKLEEIITTARRWLGLDGQALRNLEIAASEPTLRSEREPAGKDPGIVVTGKKPQKNKEGKPHRYASRVPNACSKSESMDALKSPWASAPGASTAAQEGTTQLMLWGFIPFLPFLDTDLTRPNPVGQVVDTTGGRIINIAEDGHIFYPGTVDTRVTETSRGSVVETVGTGTGEYTGLNMFAGLAFFGTRNHLLAMGCDATKNPTDGPMFDLR